MVLSERHHWCWSGTILPIGWWVVSHHIIIIILLTILHLLHLNYYHSYSASRHLVYFTTVFDVLSTESKGFEFKITVLGQSAEFSLNCNICFFYKRNSGATPVLIYIFIYIIILFSILVLLFSTYLLRKPNKPDFYQKLLYIINHYLLEFLQLLLTLLFIWLKNTLTEYVEMRLQMKIAQSNVIYVIGGAILTA